MLFARRWKRRRACVSRSLGECNSPTWFSKSTKTFRVRSPCLQEDGRSRLREIDRGRGFARSMVNGTQTAQVERCGIAIGGGTKNRGAPGVSFCLQSPAKVFANCYSWLYAFQLAKRATVANLGVDRFRQHLVSFISRTRATFLSTSRRRLRSRFAPITYENRWSEKHVPRRSCKTSGCRRERSRRGKRRREGSFVTLKVSRCNNDRNSLRHANSI